MSVRIFRLPLFPLHHVLFPQVPLSLNIFEERYKVMIRECIEQGQPFGVVLIRRGSEVGGVATPYSIGCTARIVEVETLQDGCMELLTLGEERFRLLEQREVEVRLPQGGTAEFSIPSAYQSYLVGFVERLEEEPCDRESLQSAANEVLGLFIHYLRCLATYTDMPLPPIDLPNDPELLTYFIGALMKLPLEIKQNLLSATRTQERLEMEEKLLRYQIAQLEGYAGSEEWKPDPETPIIPDTPQLITRMRKEDWKRYFRDGRN